MDSQVYHAVQDDSINYHQMLITKDIAFLKRNSSTALFFSRFQCESITGVNHSVSRQAPPPSPALKVHVSQSIQILAHEIAFILARKERPEPGYISAMLRLGTVAFSSRVPLEYHCGTNSRSRLSRILEKIEKLSERSCNNYIQLTVSRRSRAPD
ncbi:uncharacterized protein H6S33_006338 [Morchella sextelata]|uniref:uncharacterized protein n=1 Tax=Morchella sextelata TaxID=1174677 RepID=UPI001D03EAF2|nr:uncharacterized protein H6S33_006338 [Morchella sextelata]KAH0604670.1 hypothetical protein H6S33_006338 [Morchella sextelata]